MSWAGRPDPRPWPRPVAQPFDLAAKSDAGGQEGLVFGPRGDYIAPLGFLSGKRCAFNLDLRRHSSALR
jgi:hypothetical protein